MKITVDALIASPFSTRTEKDKLKVISDGRPRPSIKMPTFRVKEPAHTGACTKRGYYDQLMKRYREMNNSVQSLYSKIQWLTFSATTQCFYCWPCLLFQPPGLWNETSISDIVSLTEGAPEHEETSEHIEAVFQLQTFINQNSDTRNDEIDTVNKNPEVLKRLAKIVSTLAIMQQPPIEYDSSGCLFGIEKCVQVMQLLLKYDSLDKCHSDDAIDMIKNSPEVIDNTANAVAKVMKLSIIKEISSSKYVSLILSRHSNVRLNAQISTVLRYVKDGKVCERFLEFTHIFQSASVDSIHQYIMGIVDEFKLTKKCIAISLDGAILSSDHLICLLRKLKNDIRDCIFVPWHSHGVNHVLQKCLSEDQRCEHFFKIIAAMEAYLCENTGRAFYDFVTENELESISMNARCAGNWYVKSDFIIYVVKHRQQLVKFFDSVIANSSKWHADDITQALGFRESLQDSSTVFLFIVFSNIFGLTSALNSVLSSDIPERNFGVGMVQKLIRNLKKMRRNFKDLWATAVEEIGREVQNLDEKLYAELFRTIIKQVTEEVELRYSVLDNFEFCKMFDFLVCGWFDRTPLRYQNLTEFYKTDFSLQRVVTEMKVVVEYNAFSKISVHDFHQHIFESSIKNTLIALFDISELILALPFKKRSAACHVSTSNKIEQWSFGPKDSLTCYNTSIIFVESDFLQEIMQSPSFYDQVFHNMSL